MLKLMYPFGFIKCAPACLDTLLEAIEVRQYQDLISLSKASRPAREELYHPGIDEGGKRAPRAIIKELDGKKGSDYTRP
jgi:hypothetical protein